MKKKTKLFIMAIAFMFLIPLVSVNAENKSEKVKVYMFEAGGCPYCEQQEEYFKGLDSYDKKFELIKKELYVDHVDWEPGKDYDLGVKVADAFKDAGFEDATYQGTPFVVISDLYAAASYNTSLEDVINEAYETGDKDIVGCYEDGNTDCLDHLKKENDSNSKSGSSDSTTLVTTIVCTLIIIIIYLLKSNNDKKEIIELINKKEKSKRKSSK